MTGIVTLQPNQQKMLVESVASATYRFPHLRWSALNIVVEVPAVSPEDAIQRVYDLLSTGEAVWA